MSLRIAVAVLIGLLLFLVSHITTMTLLEVTPDEMQSAIHLFVYIIIQLSFAIAISYIVSYIVPIYVEKALYILITTIGIISLPSLFQIVNLWNACIIYLLILPNLFFGRYLIEIIKHRVISKISKLS